ncbi:MAG: shikimate kinase [Candidatus Aegiribacteria sp.]|nr:shikimate kinase [Candidatus Aegiribacteria sp.]
MEKENKTVSIFLAGPPCAGKSSTGQVLASMLGLPFYDLDKLIEKIASLSIPEIFNKLGEQEFRKLESDALLSLLKTRKTMILALGGGCLLKERNLIEIKKKGIIVTLTASDEILLERCKLQIGYRPLITTDKAFIELLKRRKEHYNSLPNNIDTSYTSPEQTALKITNLGSGSNT